MNRSHRPPARTPRERGFTLVEIMVVIVILGLLSTLVATNVINIFGKSEEETARFDVGGIDQAIRSYRVINRAKGLPTLEELITPDEKSNQAWLDGFSRTPRDPWGTVYEIRAGENDDTWLVLCAGKDKTFDTEDDISSKTLKDR